MWKWKNINLEECLSHINRCREFTGDEPADARPAVTISRMSGSGGRTVASKLADYLQPHSPYGRHWTIFDQGLIKKVLEDHQMAGQLAEFLPESNKPLLKEMLAKLHGRKVSESMIVEQTVETIWRLAESGYVILIGRGANVITATLPNVFHLRLVGSMEKRIERLEEVYDFNRHEAIDYLKSQDTAKREYLKDYFGKDIDDPQLYHLILNTDRITYEDAAALIGEAVLKRFKLGPGVRV